MRVAVLACTRRVRCCEEEWQAVQRAHRGRGGRHWCAGPWCVEIGTPAGAAAGGAAWVITLPRGRVTRAAYDYAAAAGEGGRFVGPSRPRPPGACGCGCGLARAGDSSAGPQAAQPL